MTGSLVVLLAAGCTYRALDEPPDTVWPPVRIYPPITRATWTCPPRPPVNDEDWFADADGDCYNWFEDCNDSDPYVNPSWTDPCNGVDDDCDGRVDPISFSWLDADGDGFGAGAVLEDCGLGPEYVNSVDKEEDCDDTRADVAPDGAVDIPGDGIDQDCSGSDACGTVCELYDCDTTVSGADAVSQLTNMCRNYQEYTDLAIESTDLLSLEPADCLCRVETLELREPAADFTLVGTAAMGVSGALYTFGGTFAGFDVGPDLPFALYAAEEVSSLAGLEGVRSAPAIGLGYWEPGYYGEYYDAELITSLEPLGNLEEVAGTFSIRGAWELTTLHGLEKLRSVGGDFSIVYTGASNAQGLESLRTVGSLDFRANHLVDFVGLEGLTEVDGDFTIGEEAVKWLRGLEGLWRVGGDLRLGGCKKLGSLEGLEGLEHLGGLDFSELALTSLDPVGSALSTPEHLSLGDLPLLSLQGLEGVTEVNGSVGLGGLQIPNLAGLDSLTRVGNRLVITANPALVSLDGLDSLTEVDYLTLEDNPVLSSLAGLDALTRVNRSIVITGNPLLPDAEIMRFLNHLGRANIGGTVTIEGNGD